MWELKFHNSHHHERTGVIGALEKCDGWIHIMLISQVKFFNSHHHERTGVIGALEKCDGWIQKMLISQVKFYSSLGNGCRLVAGTKQCWTGGSRTVAT